MLKEIEEYAHKYGMLEKNDIVIAGVSGGADSICLLFVLSKLREKIGFELIAVHVNHGIRGRDADEDQAYVEEICRDYHVECINYCKNVELIAQKRKQSMEEAGRDARREAFEDALSRSHGTKIALAHHMNDNAETLIFNLSRGTGMKGLGGIRPVNGRIIRPLLCVDRAAIEMYLAQEGIHYCTDCTNGTDDYARNRIRNHVVPCLQETVNAKAVQHMNQTMEYMARVWDYMEEEADIWYGKSVRCEKDKNVLIDRPIFKEVPDIMKPLIISRALAHTAGSKRDITSSHLCDIEELFGKQTGRRINLPYSVTAEVEYDNVRIYKYAEKEPYLDEEPLIPREAGEISADGTAVAWKVFEKPLEGFWPAEKTYTKWFDYDIIKGNVVIRTRREGDYITIDKEGNKKKLKKFFVDEKIPREERGRMLLITEGNHVLWIIGFRMNSAYQISEHTKHILEIVINGGEEDGRDSQSINTGRRGR